MSYPVDYALDEGQRRFWKGTGVGRRGPQIVCLCGSTRFWRDFQEQGLRETMEGRIVLSIGAARSADDDDKTFGGYTPQGEYDEAKERLDALHLWKVALADEVLVLNVGGYVGRSTAREIAHAQQLGKPIRYLEPAAEQRRDELLAAEAARAFAGDVRPIMVPVSDAEWEAAEQRAFDAAQYDRAWPVGAGEDAQETQG